MPSRTNRYVLRHPQRGYVAGWQFANCDDLLEGTWVPSPQQAHEWVSWEAAAIASRQWRHIHGQPLLLEEVRSADPVRP